MEEIRGLVARIIYRNEDNIYTVFELETEEGTLTCTGYPPAVREGESCALEGDYVSHPLYGDQFRVQSYTPLPPENTQALLRYLSSGAVKGIGQALAARIIRKFGEDSMRILDEEPERLAEVKGISARGAREIAAALEGQKDFRDAMIFLQKYGIGGRQAVKIWETYGMRLYTVLKENPYQLADEIRGIGFATADAIAARAGIRADSDFRIRSGLVYVLGQALGEGHCCLPVPVLTGRTASLLELPAETVEIQMRNLAVDRRLQIRMKEGEAFASDASVFRTEQQTARMLLELSGRAETGGRDRVEKKIRDLEDREGIRLDDLQRRAVETAVSHTVFILTGGPGTGKTTTIRTIISYLEAEDQEVLLAAPTGRAAKRMTEATGREAMTIHRLLGVRARPEEETGDRMLTDFDRDGDNPLEADAVIVDEMSMVDVFLFHSLLKAVMPGTRLILVGDEDQLPSVGPGCVLRDLTRSGVFPALRLEKIFRQAAKSDIILNAHRILRGETPVLDNQSRDFFFLERRDVQVIYKHMVDLMRDKLPGYVGCRPLEIQVLTPMRKGALGVETLNGVLQSVLNPPARGKREYKRQDTVFREGDKVMQTRNNYQAEWEIRGNFGIPIEKGTGIFNGDCGVVEEIDEQAGTMQVLFDEEKTVVFPLTDLDDLDLAYAVTVHKSQGSEYPAVLLPLLSGPQGLMNRNLLYTAVTRARSLVVILGSREAVAAMTANVQQYVRYTGLEDRIRELVIVESTD